MGRKYIEHDEKRSRTVEWGRALYIGWTIAFVVAFVITGSILFKTLADPLSTEYWADSLGLTSLTASLFQFVPQIISTWKAQKVGALSIPAMFLQAPGSFVVVYTLAARPGNNITTWITYLVAGSLQMILLFICLYFAWRDRRAQRQESVSSDEQERLLADNEQKEETVLLIEDEDLVSNASTAHGVVVEK
jgi:hypothetical protein